MAKGEKNLLDSFYQISKTVKFFNLNMKLVKMVFAHGLFLNLEMKYIYISICVGKINSAPSFLKKYFILNFVHQTFD